MSLEAQTILKKIYQTKNVKNEDGEFTQKAVRYMTHKERETKQSELERIQADLSPQNENLPGHVLLTPEARKNLVNYQRFLKRDLAENVAPRIDDFSPEDQQMLRNEEKMLAEKIQEGMPFEEDMRRNPAGAVGNHLKWEAKSKHQFVLPWKNLRRITEPDDMSDDVANVEILRRSKAMLGQPSTFMADAQVPGHFALTNQAKEKYGEVFGHEYAENSPLSVAEKRELDELRLLKKEMDEKKQAMRERGLKLAAKGQKARMAKIAREAKREFEAEEKEQGE